MSQKNKKISSPAPVLPALSPVLKALIYGGLVWTAFVVFIYVRSNSLSPFFEKLDLWFPPGWPSFTVLFSYGWSFLVLTGMIFGMFALGYSLLRPLSSLSELSKSVLSLVLGLGVMALLILLLGVFQLFTLRIFFVVWMLGAFGFLFVLKWGALNSLKEAKKELLVSIKASPILYTVFLVLFLYWGLKMAFVPELFYDALVYHLGVPRWYILEGGIKQFPNLHSNYPFNMQMTYTLGLAMGGVASAKLVHWASGVMLALLMIAWGNRFGKPSLGIWSAVAFISVPMLQWNMWTTGVDVGVSLFALAAAFCWYLYNFPEGGQPQDRKILILAGVFAGFSFGSKLTGGLVVGVAMALQLAAGFMKRKEVKAALMDSFFLGLAAFVVMLPWFAKAYVFTGNPVFPFFSKWFGGLDAERMSRFYGESQGVTPQTFLQWLAFPWKLTFEGNSALSFMGPLYLAFLPLSLVFLFSRKSHIPISLKLLFCFALLGMVGFSFVNRLTRYWLPFLAIWTVFIGWVAVFLSGHSKPLKWTVWFLSCWLFFANFVIGTRMSLSNYNFWNVLLGRESRVDFQSYTHPGLNPFPSVVMYEWAKKNLPVGSKILIIGDEKVAPLEVPFLASGVYDKPILSEWASESKTPEELRAKFDANGITHIMVNLYEGSRLLGYGTADYTPEEVARIVQFWDRNVRFVHQETIPERQMGNIDPPINMYKLVPADQTIPQQPQWNPVLWFYEEANAPSGKANSMREKIKLFESLSSQFPEVAIFQLTLRELRSKQPQ